MKSTNLPLWVACACLALSLCACGTKVQYGDATGVETLTANYGSTDLQMVAAKMVQSMLATPIIQEGNRPVLQVATVVNKSQEHIDTQAITDKIRTTLLQSGKVRFSAGEVRDEMIQELQYQQGSGYVDPTTSKKIGKQVGADYLLTGAIAEILKQKDKDKDVYFKFTMNLVNLETGLIEWADEKEIRKTEK